MKRLTIERYDEFLDALNDGFNKEVPKWFRKELEHIYPSIKDIDEIEDWQRKLIESNYYVEKDGEIVSGLALYEMDMKCIVNNEKIKMKLGGIGSVFTRDSERGRGLMTSNLKYATELLSEHECDVSWLAGDRKRYSRFGWDIAGRVYEYKILLKDIENYYEEIREELSKDNPVILSSRADNKNLDRVKGLYERYNMGIERDCELWLRQINRSKLFWRVFETECRNKNDLAHFQEGYFVTFQHDKSTIIEIQGDNMITVKSLIMHMKEENIDMLKIRMPYGEQSMNRLFMNFASDVSIVNAGMVKVVNSMSVLSKINFHKKNIKMMTKYKLMQRQKCSYGMKILK